MKELKKMILRFTDKLPQALYLDSSVILNAIMTGSKFHNECASFLRRLRTERIRCATASLSLDEIWYVLIKTKVESLAKGSLIEVYKRNHNSILLAKGDVERVTFDLLGIENLEILTVDVDIMLRAKGLMWEYKLLPRDSVHLAACLKHGIKAMVTTDRDFISASEVVDIYTCNPNLFKKGD
ncbi:type II toxin-antitoxin system VapC family toxin [Dehalococcoidia bacterium]|nr:type II toxin-antitoxin system VapC family toxin [Dehalococcoidia bacterium]